MTIICLMQKSLNAMMITPPSHIESRDILRCLLNKLSGDYMLDEKYLFMTNWSRPIILFY